MKARRFLKIAETYRLLEIVVAGDFFLDRYLEIDPARVETSIETGLPVYNVSNVRNQPGAAGTILNNFVALGVRIIHAVGFCGFDGEGFELRKALRAQPGVYDEDFLTSNQVCTPVYCKPLLMGADGPIELSRFDRKNTTPTPAPLDRDLCKRLANLLKEADICILMDQVETPETGVVTKRLAAAVHTSLQSRRALLVLADSRRGVGHLPPLGYKMNAAELARLTADPSDDIERIQAQAAALADRTKRPVFITLAERGIVGALPDQPPEHVPAHPVHGPIDIVGAGDAVTANLAAALVSDANLREAMEIAMAAASVVIHQVGATGTASIEQIAERLKDLAS